MLETPKAEDIKKMVDLGKLMWEEGAFKVTKRYDRAAAFDFTVHALEEYLSNNGFYVKVCKEASGDHEVYGMIIGQIVPYFFCPDQFMAVDHVVYVHPDRRGSPAGVKLVRGFEKWAQEIGATEMSIGVSTGIHPEKTHGFYQKMGYNWTGGVYKKHLNNGD